VSASTKKRKPKLLPTSKATKNDDHSGDGNLKLAANGTQPTVATPKSASSPDQDVAPEGGDIQKKKRRRKSQKKDPKAPKRPLNSYACYFKTQRPSLKEARPDLGPRELTNELASIWKTLTDEDKKKWQKMADQDKIRYAKDMENYSPPQIVRGSDQDELQNGDKKPAAKVTRRKKPSTRKPAAKRTHDAIDAVAEEDDTFDLAEVDDDETEIEAEGDQEPDETSIAKKRKKSTRKESKKDPSAPMKPFDAFLMFSNAHRPELNAASPCFGGPPLVSPDANVSPSFGSPQLVSPEHIPDLPFPTLFTNGSKDYRDAEDHWLSLCHDPENSEHSTYEGGDHFFTHGD
jgi:hypothetical protein